MHEKDEDYLDQIFDTKPWQATLNPDRPETGASKRSL